MRRQAITVLVIITCFYAVATGTPCYASAVSVHKVLLFHGRLAGWRYLHKATAATEQGL